MWQGHLLASRDAFWRRYLQKYHRTYMFLSIWSFCSNLPTIMSLLRVLLKVLGFRAEWDVGLVDSFLVGFTSICGRRAKGQFSL